MGYKFQYIVDSRFPKDYNKNVVTKEDLLNEIRLMDKKLKDSIEPLKILGVDLRSSEPRYLNFSRIDYPNGVFNPRTKEITFFEDASFQCRIDYYIYKKDKQITWNSLFKIINSIQAPVYSEC